MKKFLYGALLLCLAACQKQQITDPQKEADASGLPSASIPVITPPPMPYLVVLESKVQNPDGSYTWTWSIRNARPGNGTGGTVQDLSHWNMGFGTCVDVRKFTAVEISKDGSNWTATSRELAVDPSQNCVAMPVLKFDVSTTGTAKSWCRITTTADYDVDVTSVGFYKSGRKTGCGTLWFAGMGCNVVLDN